MFSNQVKLTVIALFTLIVSGYLFWQGLSPEFSRLENSPLPSITSLNSPQITSTSEGVLGEARKPIPPEELFKVNKVVDGDTIEVLIQGIPTKVRMIGVNTPETVDPRRPVQCFGKEASEETKRVLSDKYVNLQKDVSETDKYGRLLRYVYLPLDDGTILFINDYLVRQGYAQSSTYPPDVKYKDRFKEAENEARENNRGLWSKC
jgi:endonuclease YncB( thermonuclease family)